MTASNKPSPDRPEAQAASDCMLNPVFAEVRKQSEQAFGAMAQNQFPLARAIGRTNLELMALASRRLNAYATLPQRMTQMRSPTDLTAQTFSFWQAAASDYLETANRVAGAWMALSPIDRGLSALVPGMDVGAQSAAEAAKARDTIILSGGGNVSGVTGQGSSESEPHRRTGTQSRTGKEAA